MYPKPDSKQTLTSNIIDLMYRYPTAYPFEFAKKLLAVWALEHLEKQWPLPVVKVLECYSLDDIVGVIWENYKLCDIYNITPWLETVLENLYPYEKDFPSEYLRFFQGIGLITTDKEGAKLTIVKISDLTHADHKSFKRLVGE